MPNRLFITGMFRSGTTLLARMLHAHGDIVCASDPYRPFFNCLRDSIAQETGVSVEAYAHLGSYVGDEAQRELFDAIQSASLDRRFDRDRTQLLDQIKAHGRPYSPRISEHLDAIDGETFAEIYENLLGYVPEYYGQGDETWEATKEVWTTEFVPALSRTFPESKFLVIVRDPRAVSASNNTRPGQKYPWTFLARQWRKLATLTWVYDTHADIAERVHVVTYENLVENPRVTASGICDFLDIEVDERILDPSNFVDGRGEQWIQNTNFGEGKMSFDTASVDKWKRVLDGPTTALLEQLCYLEMRLFGYEFEAATSYGIGDELLLSPPLVRSGEMADWITEHYEGRTRTSVRTELGVELVRQRMVTCEQSVREQLDPETIRTYFLDEQFFETARSGVEP